MPPIRTVAMNKPIKTERTHEENQERAYIAASRRSDRSLEARVESARRASEIHKKRTGRSLRVTEQDVINEEMYEEEDDDLPMQYRRLTAHLQTGSADFNRRLAAYLSNHVAMRSALDQAMAGNYASQYSNAPQFAPMSQPPQSAYPPNMMMYQNTQPHRQSPYPASGPHPYRPQPQQRPANVAHPQEYNKYPPNTVSSASSSRRSSMALNTPNPGQQTRPTPSQLTPLQMRPQPPRAGSAYDFNSQNVVPAMPGHSPGSSSPTSQWSAPQSATPPYAFDRALSGFSPFTTALPAEAQQLLGPALDPNDPFTSMLMNGSEHHKQPFYSYNPNPTGKPRKTFQQFDGMNQTLAPSALDTPDMFNTTSPQSASTDPDVTPFTPSFDLGTFGASLYDFTKPSLTRSSSAQGDGQQTPALADWASFIDSTNWEETTV